MNGKVKCPKCGREGLIAKKPTITKIAGKAYKYQKLYVAHYLPNGLSKKSGKRVNRVQWCYLNKEQIAALEKKGVITQSVTQNVTQNDVAFCVTSNNPNPSSISENTVYSGGAARIWTGVTSARGS